ncbi:MAG: N-acetylglucosaminyl-diphospho-decaprenol L-rhamnosyltransferase [Lentisphaerae bacterium ADurb.BinA184]|nr:MAG: N-acetylglucosaminyl-diphospho-decaprenol L-rhamnosyltransferase [Lentisphaerae bacterium ADurb.BinA184]
MRVSVITLTHNQLAVTRRCLESWLEATGAEWELVVVENGSADGTREWLAGFARTAAARGVEVRVILNDRNLGCSTARNQALAEARGELVAFMDNDVALRNRDWLAALGRALDREKDAVAVGPKLVYPFPPHDIQCAGVAISPHGRVQFRGRGEPRDDPRFSQPAEVQCLISACCLARLGAVREAGGFDEAFNPVQFEDFDLCYRLREAGGRLYYVPAVEMYHFESVTTAGTETIPNTRVIVRNGLRFKRRWQHRFAHESGPPDADCRWRAVATPRFDEIGGLPVVG